MYFTLWHFIKDRLPDMAYCTCAGNLRISKINQEREVQIVLADQQLCLSNFLRNQRSLANVELKHVVHKSGEILMFVPKLAPSRIRFWCLSLKGRNCDV